MAETFDGMEIEEADRAATATACYWLLKADGLEQAGVIVNIDGERIQRLLNALTAAGYQPDISPRGCALVLSGANAMIFEEAAKWN